MFGFAAINEEKRAEPQEEFFEEEEEVLSEDEHFSDIEDSEGGEDSEGEDAHPRKRQKHGKTREALEAEAIAAYQSALNAHGKGKASKAIKKYKKMLRNPIVRRAQEERSIPLVRNIPLFLRYLGNKNLADVYFGMAKYRRALKHYWNAVAVDRTDCVVWYRAGFSAYEIGNVSASRYALEQSLVVNPSFMLARKKLIRLLFSIGAFQDCMLLFRDVYIEMATQGHARYSYNGELGPLIIMAMQSDPSLLGMMQNVPGFIGRYEHLMSMPLTDQNLIDQILNVRYQWTKMSDLHGTSSIVPRSEKVSVSILRIEEKKWPVVIKAIFDLMKATLKDDEQDKKDKQSKPSILDNVECFISEKTVENNEVPEDTGVNLAANDAAGILNSTIDEGQVQEVPNPSASEAGVKTPNHAPGPGGKSADMQIDIASAEKAKEQETAEAGDDVPHTPSLRKSSSRHKLGHIEEPDKVTKGREASENEYEQAILDCINHKQWKEMLRQSLDFVSGDKATDRHARRDADANEVLNTTAATDAGKDSDDNVQLACIEFCNVLHGTSRPLIEIVQKMFEFLVAHPEENVGSEEIHYMLFDMFHIVMHRQNGDAEFQTSPSASLYMTELASNYEEHNPRLYLAFKDKLDRVIFKAMMRDSSLMDPDSKDQAVRKLYIRYLLMQAIVAERHKDIKNAATYYELCLEQFPRRQKRQRIADYNRKTRILLANVPAMTEVTLDALKRKSHALNVHSSVVDTDTLFRRGLYEDVVKALEPVLLGKTRKELVSLPPEEDEQASEDGLVVNDSAAYLNASDFADEEDDPILMSKEERSRLLRILLQSYVKVSDVDGFLRTVLALVHLELGWEYSLQAPHRNNKDCFIFACSDERFHRSLDFLDHVVSYIESSSVNLHFDDYDEVNVDLIRQCGELFLQLYIHCRRRIAALPKNFTVVASKLSETLDVTATCALRMLLQLSTIWRIDVKQPDQSEKTKDEDKDSDAEDKDKDVDKDKDKDVDKNKEEDEEDEDEEDEKEKKDSTAPQSHADTDESDSETPHVRRSRRQQKKHEEEDRKAREAAKAAEEKKRREEEAARVAAEEAVVQAIAMFLPEMDEESRAKSQQDENDDATISSVDALRLIGILHEDLAAHSVCKAKKLAFLKLSAFHLSKHDNINTDSDVLPRTIHQQTLWCLAGFKIQRQRNGRVNKEHHPGEVVEDLFKSRGCAMLVFRNIAPYIFDKIDRDQSVGFVIEDLLIDIAAHFIYLDAEPSISAKASLKGQFLSKLEEKVEGIRGYLLGQRNLSRTGDVFETIPQEVMKVFPKDVVSQFYFVYGFCKMAWSTNESDRVKKKTPSAKTPGNTHNEAHRMLDRHRFDINQSLTDSNLQLLRDLALNPERLTTWHAVSLTHYTSWETAMNSTGYALSEPLLCRNAVIAGNSMNECFDLAKTQTEKGSDNKEALLLKCAYLLYCVERKQMIDKPKEIRLGGNPPSFVAFHFDESPILYAKKCLENLRDLECEKEIAREQPPVAKEATLYMLGKCTERLAKRGNMEEDLRKAVEYYTDCHKRMKHNSVCAIYRVISLAWKNVQRRVLTDEKAIEFMEMIPSAAFQRWEPAKGDEQKPSAKFHHMIIYLLQYLLKREKYYFKARYRLAMIYASSTSHGNVLLALEHMQMIFETKKKTKSKSRSGEKRFFQLWRQNRKEYDIDRPGSYLGYAPRYLLFYMELLYRLRYVKTARRVCELVVAEIDEKEMWEYMRASDVPAMKSKLLEQYIDMLLECLEDMESGQELKPKFLRKQDEEAKKLLQLRNDAKQASSGMDVDKAEDDDTTQAPLDEATQDADEPKVKPASKETKGQNRIVVSDESEYDYLNRHMSICLREAITWNTVLNAVDGKELEDALARAQKLAEKKKVK